MLDWAQIVFLAIVAIVGIGGMIKVLFFDKAEK
jgi:hypothetical protein